MASSRGIEREAVLKAVNQHHGNKSAAARELGVTVGAVRYHVAKAATYDPAAPRKNATPTTSMMGPDPQPYAPATPKKLRAIDLQREIGVPGLKHWFGRLYEEFLPALTYDRGRRAFVEMAWNEPTVAAILFAVKTLTRQADWHVNPADESPEATERAEFVESCFHDLDVPWTAVLAELWSMLIYGFAVLEPVVKVRRGRKSATPSNHDDGLLGWAKLAPRHQETIFRWHIDPVGTLTGITQWAPPLWQFVDIDMERLLLFRTDEWHSSPEGMSILRGAFVPYSLKKTVQMVEAIGIERDACGVPVARMPADRMALVKEPGADGVAAAAELASLQTLVRDLKTDQQHGIVFPLAYDQDGNELYKLELMRAGGARSIDCNTTIMRYKQEIASTVLADFILLGHEKVGSFSLASSKTELFAMSCNALMDSVCGIFNRVAIPRLCELNGWDGPFPTLEHGDLETPDLAELGGYVTALTNAGINLLDDETVRHLRRAANLPTPDAEDMPAPQPVAEPV